MSTLNFLKVNKIFTFEHSTLLVRIQTLITMKFTLIGMYSHVHVNKHVGFTKKQIERHWKHKV